jgi:hypothetical protein
MLVITTVSILLLASACFLSRRFQDQRTLSRPPIEMLKLGVQIICGDCCGDSDRPVKTYLDQFGRCGQCGGHSYVLASVYACTRMLDRTPQCETRSTLRHQQLSPQVSFDAVRIQRIGA